MANLIIKPASLRIATNQAIKAVEKIMVVALNKMDDLLFKEAERLAVQLRDTPEFQELKTPMLIGQFGFTPAEVARLDDLLGVVAPSANTEITNVKKSLSGKRKSIVLNWVDFDKLKGHQVAEHPLTRINPRDQSIIDDGQVVSWIEWWEEGVTIRGHIFTRGNQFSQPFSRSLQGLMQERSGGTFAIRPTRVFERLGTQGQGVKKSLENAFISLVRKRR